MKTEKEIPKADIFMNKQEAKNIFMDFLCDGINQLTPENAEKINLKQVREFTENWIDKHFLDIRE